MKSSLPANQISTEYFDSIVRGLATQNSQQIDSFFSDAVKFLSIIFYILALLKKFTILDQKILN